MLVAPCTLASLVIVAFAGACSGNSTPVFSGSMSPGADSGVTTPPDASVPTVSPVDASTTAPASDADVQSDAGDAAVAPLQQLAFAGQLDGQPNWDIYTSATDGTGLKRLTNDPANDTYPAWSPDGLQIAFSSQRTGMYQVHLLTLATGDVTQLVQGMAYSAAPAFAGDGLHIAFEGEAVAGEGVGIYVVARDGTAPMRITDHTRKSVAPFWSPDGASVMYSSTASAVTQIYATAPDGTGSHAVTSGSGLVGRAAISPNGTTLAVERNTSGATRIELVELVAGSIRVFTANDDFEPAFSAGGDLLAWASQRGGSASLRVAPSNDAIASTKVSLPSGIVASPAFRPLLVH